MFHPSKYWIVESSIDLRTENFARNMSFMLKEINKHRYCVMWKEKRNDEISLKWDTELAFGQWHSLQLTTIKRSIVASRTLNMHRIHNYFPHFRMFELAWYVSMCVDFLDVKIFTRNTDQNQTKPNQITQPQTHDRRSQVSEFLCTFNYCHWTMTDCNIKNHPARSKITNKPNVCTAHTASVDLNTNCTFVSVVTYHNVKNRSLGNCWCFIVHFVNWNSCNFDYRSK